MTKALIINSIRAFEGTINHMVKIQDDGSLVITPVCAAAGLGGKKKGMVAIQHNILVA